MAIIVKYRKGSGEIQTCNLPNSCTVQDAIEVLRDCGNPEVDPGKAFVEKEEEDGNGNKVWWIGIKQGTKG